MTARIYPGAIESRRREIEARLHLWRRYTYSSRRQNLAAACAARLPEPGEFAPMREIAQSAALTEIRALADRGVLVLGPSDGPQPRRRS